MSDIREGINGIPEPDRSIGLLLMDFYEQMKALERDPHRGGKQATAIIMAINDINEAARRTPMSPGNSATPDAAQPPLADTP